MNPLTKREKWYLGLMLLLFIGFLAQNFLLEVTISGYKKAYNTAQYQFEQCERGIIMEPNFDNPLTVNMSNYNQLPNIT